MIQFQTSFIGNLIKISTSGSSVCFVVFAICYIVLNINKQCCIIVALLSTPVKYLADVAPNCSISLGPLIDKQKKAFATELWKITDEPYDHDYM